MAWQPITTPERVAAIVTAHERENEQLEFKAIYWKKEGDRPAAQEAGKDVAAFLNALGGTIVVGIGDGEGNDGVANGLASVPDPEQRARDLVEQLRASLVPSGAAEYATPVPLTVGGKGVLVVNVRPWPYGVVGVRWGGTGESYRFPVRHGARMVDLAWEDVVMRNEAARRSTWLRLHALVGGQKWAWVWIHSTVAARSGTVCMPIKPSKGQHAAYVESMSDDTLELVMLGGDLPAAALKATAVQVDEEYQYADMVGKREGWRAMESAKLSRAPGWSNHESGRLVLPLSTIREVWPTKAKSGSAPETRLLLDVDIYFEDGGWTFEAAK